MEFTSQGAAGLISLAGLVALVLFIVGVLFIIAGIKAPRRKKKTYKIVRPQYQAMLFITLGSIALLASAFTFLLAWTI